MGQGQKVIYVTAKNTQHEVAEDAVQRLQDAGVKLRSVTLHAKAKICLKDEPHCDPSFCQYAKNHYAKVAEHGVIEKLAKKKRLTAKTFRQMAELYEVCPFELQMASVARADVVICDYNYVFSPRNTLGRLTHNGYGKSKSKPSLVIDEAHNLPERAAGYFSAALSCDEFHELISRFPVAFLTLGQNLLSHLRMTVAAAAGPGFSSARQVFLRLEDMRPLYLAAQELMSRYLESGHELQTQDPVLRAANQVSEFIQRLEGLSEESFTSAAPSHHGGVLRLTCCDASRFLSEAYENFSGVVGFSATVKPFDYYSKLLGLEGEKLLSEEFDSPFPRARRKILLIPQISTKWRDREANVGKIKATIEKLVELKPGNYFVFFPSFEFLKQVAAKVNPPGFRLLLQEREMKRDRIRDYLDKLKDGEPTLIFAVQGGVFSEGVDYPGEMLIGALIVGPALPSFDFEREQLKNYFERKHGAEQAFDYAYTYPAMARVVQSAGRVIRSSQDRGLIVLMDRRFTHAAYKKSMPKDWTETEGDLISRQILKDVQSFWDSVDEP
jgi:DNA excision repair protein ERCC-2